ncbi:hypothetical protein ACFL26_01715 [Patescibacteria group bacterium]
MEARQRYAPAPVTAPGPKRIFREYRPVPLQSGGTVLFDVFDEFDPLAGGHVRRERRTSIVLPPDLSENPLAVAERCAALRRELDRSGVKIFFDRGRDSARPKPKWRYRLGGRLRTDYISPAPGASDDADTMPAELIEFVESHPDYYRMRHWLSWFGRMIQRKREEVIRRELGA